MEECGKPGGRGEVNGTTVPERKSVEVRVCKYLGWNIRVIRGTKDGKATNGIKSGIGVGNFKELQ